MSYDTAALTETVSDVMSAARRAGAIPKGPIPLPTKIEKFSVNRSPHIDKKSQEQFEIRTHLRMIELIDPQPSTLDALMRLDVPAIVKVETKVERIPVTSQKIERANRNVATTNGRERRAEDDADGLESEGRGLSVPAVS